MSSNIETEIVRLVQEIMVDEKKLKDARSNEATFRTPSIKEQYTSEAKTLEASLERKIQLIKILKG